MAVDTPHSVIGVSGWTWGQPNYDANRTLDPAAKQGANGLPGWYDEMAQQWPRLASLLGQGRAEASSGTLEHRDPPDDETPEEERFNDALLDLLARRFGVEAADGPTWGTATLLAWLYDVPWYGYAIAEPYWLDAGTDPVADGRILLRPLLRAAVQRWNVDLTTQRPQSVWYMSTPSWCEIPYDRILHLTHGGGPGEYYGRGELRPLIAPFSAWREAIRSGADAMRAAKGRLVVQEPQTLDKQARERVQSLIAGFDGGRVDSFAHPHGSVATIGYPSGSTPDFAGWMSSLDRQAELLFADRTSALGVSSSGSRATAEVLSGEDATAQASQWERIIDRGVQRIGAWVARQVGYSGRIRPVYLAVRDVAQPPADRLALYTGVEALRAQGAPVEVLRAAALDIGLDPDVIAPLPGKPAPAAGGVIAELAESYRPTQTMAEEAQRGLDWRREHGRGGTEIGIARARDIAGRRNLSADTVRRMRSYFARHEVDRQGTGWSPGEDGYPSAGRIAWALWGGDAGRAWAESRADLSDHSHHCGSDCAHLSEPVLWAGRDGRETAHGREPLVWEIDGQQVSPELTMAFAELDDLRLAADVALQVALEPIAAEHRAAVWEALATGYSERESRDIYDTYLARYERAILDYQAGLRAASSQQATAEATAAPVPTTRTGLDTRELAQWSARERERERLGARAAADAITSRVQQEVVGAYASGASASTWQTRQTVGGLAREAYGTGARIEAVATVQQAAEAAPDGLVVIAALRTSQRDPEVCDWCRSQDGMRWAFPGDQRRFLAYMDAHPMPDPSCAGGQRCRCRITLVWGRGAA